MSGAAAAAIVLVAALSSTALAGDVAASMTGKLLTLTGDDAANVLAIAKGTKTDAYVVTPAAGTTVNGNAGAATFEDVRSITISMGAGNDRVDVGAVDVRGDLRIRLDDDDDAAVLTGTVVRGRAVVRGGAGADTVRADSGARFHGAVRVLGEAGNDEIQFVGAQFRNRLRVEGGGDDDHVLVQGSTFSDLSRFEFWGGRGHDSAELVLSQFGNETFVDLGPDEDRLRLAGSRFTLDIEGFGGRGAADVLVLEAGNVFLRLETFDGFEEGEPDQP
jgi:hypothetical protein